MTRAILPALALIGLAACSPAAPETDLAKVEVKDAVCRPTPNGRDVTSCYMTLTASTKDRLVSVATPAAATTQIHEMSTEGGVMRMGEMKDGLPLPAGEAVSLAPGGNHLMLMGVTAPLKAGDAVLLTLTFEHAAPLGVNAVVGQPAPAAGGHGGH